MLRTIADRAASGDRHMRKLVQQIEELERDLGERQLAHDRKQALKGEQPRAPLDLEGARILDLMRRHVDPIMTRLRDNHIVSVDASLQDYAIADWILAAIGARKNS